MKNLTLNRLEKMVVYCRRAETRGTNKVAVICLTWDMCPGQLRLLTAPYARMSRMTMKALLANK